MSHQRPAAHRTRSAVTRANALVRRLHVLTAPHARNEQVRGSIPLLGSTNPQVTA